MELIFFLLGLAVLVLMIYMLGALRQIHQTLGESNHLLEKFKNSRKNQTPTDRVPEVPHKKCIYNGIPDDGAGVVRGDGIYTHFG